MMRGRERRCVCGWCPMELPDDHTEWSLHFLVEHGHDGYSIRFYAARTFEEELEDMMDV